jgi:hypothetical protein
MNHGDGDFCQRPSSVESEAGTLRKVSRFAVTFSEHLAQVPWCEEGSLNDAKRWLRSVKKLEQDDFYPDSLVSSLVSVPEKPECVSADESEAETEIDESDSEEQEGSLWHDVVDEETGTVEDGEAEQEGEVEGGVDDEDEDEDLCEICQLDRNHRKQLICDECEKGFHLYCLDPPLETPSAEDEWFCPGCEVYLKAAHNRNEKRTAVIDDMKAKHAAGIKEKREANDAIRLRNAKRHKQRIYYDQRIKNIAHLKAEEMKQLHDWYSSFKDMLKEAETLLKLVQLCLASEEEEVDEGDEEDDGGVYEGLTKRQRYIFG